jgi:hypothetical protein
MGLNFLVPAFFVGLLALAIPIAIHLSRRDTRKPVPFPSLMFLEKVPQKRTEKRRIHRWPLFLLRSLAVALLVLAFARPFLDRGEAASNQATGGDREVVVLLDRSYSMALSDRWERAVDAATEVVAGMSGGDRGTVILFDSGAETASESTTDRNVLRTAIRNAEPGVRTTRYAPALRYAARILSSSPLPRHALVVVSDFQRGGWDADGGETSSLRIPTGTSISTISVADIDAGVNVAIESAEFERSSVAERERVTVTARLTTNGAVSGDLPVTLEADGRPVETRTVNFGEGSSGYVAFSPLTLPETGSTRGTLRIPGDVLAADDQFHFVLSSDQRIPVLVIEGPGATPGASFFLERALSIGGTPGFRAIIRRGGELRAVDLQPNPVVILNQTPFPSGVQGERLREYVEQGGGVILLLGANAAGDWTGVLPNIPAPVDRSRGGGITLGYVDMGHPVFESFAGPRSGDFSAARFYRYRPLPAGSFPRVLAKFGDGGAALAERPVGDGRVLVWTSTLDTNWNDLTLQPVFLPFLHQMVKYAAGHEPPRSWLTVGDPFDVRGTLPAGQESGTAVSPSGERIEIAAGTPLELREVGFYELRNSQGDDRLATLAVNVDPSESELSVFDAEEMRTALLAAAEATPESTAEIGLTLAERERRQNGWWYLLIGVFVLLAAETLFSNRGAQAGGGLFDRWRGTNKNKQA